MTKQEPLEDAPRLMSIEEHLVWTETRRKQCQQDLRDCEVMLTAVRKTLKDAEIALKLAQNKFDLVTEEIRAVMQAVKRPDGRRKDERPPVEIIDQKIIEMFRQGASIPRIAFAFDYAEQTVKRKLAARGFVKFRPRTEATTEQMAAYYEEVRSTAKVAKKFGLSTTAVVKRFRKAGVQIYGERWPLKDASLQEAGTEAKAVTNDGNAVTIAGGGDDGQD